MVQVADATQIWVAVAVIYGWQLEFPFNPWSGNFHILKCDPEKAGGKKKKDGDFTGVEGEAQD